MRISTGIVSIAIGAALLSAAAAPAFAQSCRQLWVERNSIFKARGYCFKTARAISYFGNAGCSYDYEADVPLSSRERARVDYLARLEREYGCR